MKILVTASISIFSICTCRGQVNKLFTIPPGTDITAVVPASEVYLYPSFTPGTVYFKNGGLSSGKLNYNSLIGEIQFLNSNGDTLALANENTINYISISKDTFYYNKAYLQKIGGNNNITLAAERIFVMADKLKNGAYGQTNSSSATTTYNSFVADGQLKKLTVGETLVLAKTTRYFFGDQFNNFLPLTKKNILSHFSKSEEVVRDFLKANNTDFNNEADLQKLVAFLQTLK